SPLHISPHKNTRIYFCANRVFRSEDRGDSWAPVSGDLSRQIDRDTLPVFGKLQPPEAVFKHGSTSFYGNITAFAESPKKEGLLVAGTDDGLIQVTTDGGKNWAKADKFPGVPDMTFVARVVPSQHDSDTLYVAFDNHKNADFAPYLLKSADAGKTWTSIVGDLPARGSVLAFAEDHVNPKLLFCGTEFALYFTVDGGGKWHRLKSGLPTIAVKDLAIQRAMNDLVVATFGRGFYVLDDYSPLREASSETFEKQATIFPIRDAFQYPTRDQYGGRAKASRGETFYTADNPAYGATIAYHLKEALPTKKQKRREAAKGPNPKYPNLADQRAEAEEEEPAVLLTISDAEGTPVRILTGPTAAGVHRVTWDLRIPGASFTAPVSRRQEVDEDAPAFVASGPQVVPGKYRVTLSKRVEGNVTELARPVDLTVKYVGPQPLPAEEATALAEFQKQAIRLQRDLNAATGLAGELTGRLDQIKVALDQTPEAPAGAREKVRRLIARHRETVRTLSGDVFLQGRWENAPTSVRERVSAAADATRQLVDRPTGTQREQFKIARELIDRESASLRRTVETDVKELEQLLDKLGAPWTPGRLPPAKPK
ncbi:MAG TPA: hypothetical protein VKD90_26915, partial [Gemmataceae bacterium]|nr:hypothetical protein [Gemmataceae bacterium]